MHAVEGGEEERATAVAAPRSPRCRGHPWRKERKGVPPHGHGGRGGGASPRHGHPTPPSGGARLPHAMAAPRAVGKG